MNEKHHNILHCLHPIFQLIFPPFPPSLASLFSFLTPWSLSHLPPTYLTYSSLSSSLPLIFPSSHLLSILALPLIFPPSHLISLSSYLPLIFSSLLSLLCFLRLIFSLSSFLPPSHLSSLSSSTLSSSLPLPALPLIFPPSYLSSLSIIFPPSHLSSRSSSIHPSHLLSIPVPPLLFPPSFLTMTDVLTGTKVL